MKKLLQFKSLLFLFIPALALANIESSDYPKLYDSKNSRVELIIVPFKEKDSSYALVSIHNVKHPIKDYTLRYKLKKTFTKNLYGKQRINEQFWLDWDGQSMLVIENNHTADQYVLQLPGDKKEIVLSFNSEKSRGIKADTVLANYTEQEKKHIQSKFAKFNVENSKARFLKNMQTKVDAYNKLCGLNITHEIDFSNFTQKIYKRGLSYCSSPLEIMAEQCRKNSHNKSNLPTNPLKFIAKIKHYTCHIEKKSFADFNDGTLTWVVKPDGSNADYLFRYSFENMANSQ